MADYGSVLKAVEQAAEYHRLGRVGQAHSTLHRVHWVLTPCDDLLARAASAITAGEPVDWAAVVEQVKEAYWAQGEQ